MSDGRVTAIAGNGGRDLVYIVAKAPRPGISKTRLCPPLTPEQAAHLAAAFFEDVLATTAEAGLTTRVICRDAAERAALERIVDGRVPVHVQSGTGLGDALESAFRFGVRDGYRTIGVLGGDCPTAPAEALRAAYDALRLISRGVAQADVALGPSEDGGYYLLAAREVHVRLFREMTWSTNTVAEETLARCCEAGLQPFIGTPWYDVDDAPALDRLRVELREGPTTLAPHTRTALERFGGE